MPPKSSPSSPDLLVDTWGRQNRLHADKVCPQCSAIFRPHHSGSRYCSRPCSWANNGGHNKKPHTWWVNGKGYLEGYVWENGVRRRIKLHRFVMETSLGRPLMAHEDVHHLDEDKTNNDLSNLEILEHGEHSRLHNASRSYPKGYKLDLSSSERSARVLRMKKYHAARAALALARGAAP